MSLFDKLGQQPQQQQDPRQMMQRLQQNPAGMLKQAGYTVPAGMTNPQQMVMHLMQTGQVGQPRMQQILRMMGRR